MLLTATPAYTALRETAASINHSARGKIRMTGEDRARLLHAMSTNDIQGLSPGQGCYALFLNAQGRILADVNVLCFEDHLLLDTEPELLTKIYEHLDRYIIADDVTLEDVTSQTGTTSVEGPLAASELMRIGALIPEQMWSHAAWGQETVQRTSAGFRLYYPTGQAPDLGVPEATAEEARTVRIEQARPRYGEEITDRYLVQEAGLLHAISFTKGCYLGQEIVARAQHRGEVKRALARLDREGQPAPPGTELVTEAGRACGTVVAATTGERLGSALAVLAREIAREIAREPGSVVSDRAGGRYRRADPA
jgi:aminomethyltransferase